MKQIWQVLVIGAMVAVSSPGSSTAQWVEVGRPDGWRINDLLVEGPYLFAATKQGMYRSDDDGETWRAFNSGLNDSSVTSVVAGQGGLFIGTSEGAYRSNDLGGSWISINSGLPRNGPFSVRWPAVTIGSEVFIGTGFGVFRSNDGGESWTTVNFGLPGGIDDLAAVGEDLFAVSAGGLYRTVNRGLEWTEVDLGLGVSADVESVAVVGGSLFVGAEGRLLFSLDRGTSWEQVDFDMQPEHVFSLAEGGSKLYAGLSTGLFVITRQGGSWIAESSTGPDGSCTTVAVKGEIVFADMHPGGFVRSRDGGATWTVLDAGAFDDSLEALYFVGSHVYARTVYGLYLSVDDGATWETIDGAFPKTILVPTFLTNEAGIFAGTDVGVYLSTDNGRNWTSASPGEISVQALAAVGSRLYAGTGDGLFVTRDNGRSWDRTNLTIPRRYGVDSLAVVSDALVADTNMGVFVTRDDGDTWVEIDSDELDDFDWEEMEVVGDDLFFGGWEGIYRSSDIGATWVDVTPGLPGDGSVSGLTVIDDRLFVIADDRRIFRSDDLGATWQATGAQPPFGALGVFTAAGEELFIQTRHGIFVSADLGERWDVLPGEVMHVVLALAEAGSALFAGTRHGGIYVNQRDGRGWEPSCRGFPGEDLWDLTGFAYAADKLFVSAGNGIYTSVDSGKSWKQELSMRMDGPAVWSLLAVDNSVLLGTMFGIYKTIDNGESWAPMRPDMETWEGIENLRVVGSTLMTDLSKSGTHFLAEGGYDWQPVDDQYDDEESTDEVSTNFEGMTTLAVFGDTIFARKNNRPGMYMSSDSGASWSKTDAGIPGEVELTSVSIYWRDLHAHSEDEDFVSIDGGKSWFSIGSGPPEGTMIWDYSISSTHVFAGSVDGEVWRRPRLEPSHAER